MVSFRSIASSALLLVPVVRAHFIMDYPPTIGVFDEDIEPNAPCGGYTPDFSKDNVTDFHVGGDTITVTSGHPQITFLFRLTTNQTASGNWTEVYNMVQQDGLGEMCLPNVTIPDTYIGQKAVLGIVADSPDGILYQCAVVNFVSDKATSTPSGCVNATGVSATSTTDAKLTGFVGAASSNSSTSTGTSTSTSSSASSSSSAKSEAALVHGPFNGIYSLLTMAIMFVLGATTFLL